VLAKIQCNVAAADVVLLSAFTSISPDIPLLVLVKASFFTQGPDILRDATFIVTGLEYQQISL
jgi:hypothetical protein